MRTRVHGDWSARYVRQPSWPNDFVFVPALVLAGAPIGALPTSCRRLFGEGSAQTVLSKLLKKIADRAAGTAWSSATYPIATRSWWSLPAAKSLMYALGTMDLRPLRLGRSSKCGDDVSVNGAQLLSGSRRGSEE
jgi:hypothetical protein